MIDHTTDGSVFLAAPKVRTLAESSSFTQFERPRPLYPNPFSPEEKGPGVACLPFEEPRIGPFSHPGEGQGRGCAGSQFVRCNR